MTLTDVAIPQPGDPRGGELRGLLGVPDGDGPFVPLVVLHEAFGVDDAMRDHLERLTRLGYLVLMPDLYSRGGARRCLVARPSTWGWWGSAWAEASPCCSRVAGASAQHP